MVMEQPGGLLMERVLVGKHSLLNSSPRWLRAAGMSLLFAVALAGTAFGQDIPVSGAVTNAAGAPIAGVTVRVEGTDIRTNTDANGIYRITAPANATLTFAHVGSKPFAALVAGRRTVDVTLTNVTYLEEVVVTAYTEQRRADITGAVSSANVDEAKKQTQASVLKALDVAVPGVTVQTSGSPGSRSTVRIRGISSFQNNDPLYVVDGTAVSDSYINFLNPDDIASIQVLKDASAAYIYAGQAVPTGVYGDPNNPSIPNYYYATPSAILTKDAFGRIVTVDASKYSYPNALIEPASAGTNWWKTVFGSAPVSDYNLDVRGGGEANAYAVSFNYFDQQGTAAYNDFRRGSVRVNTSFNRSKFNFGENIALTVDRHYGGTGTFDDASGENGVLGKDILIQPIVSVYDIAGNFGGGRGVPGVNSSNPLKNAIDAKDNINKDTKVFGNVFAGLNVSPKFTLKSRLGFNLQQNSFAGYNAIT